MTKTRCKKGRFRQERADKFACKKCHQTANSKEKLFKATAKG